MLAEHTVTRQLQPLTSTRGRASTATAEQFDSTTCCLCHHDLASHEATLWIPGIDLPAHEGCLTLELSAL